MTTVRGDFNGDGRDDLAVGVPFEHIGAIADAGAVNVIYGTRNGLRATGNQFWHRNSSGIDGVASAGDAFGYSLAAGDFNGDGFDDLAIGTPFDDLDGVTDAGSVNVLYGSAIGLRNVNDQFWSQNSSGINDVAETSDSFGVALTTGDFNNDGFDDLAVGAADESIGNLNLAGRVHIIFGRSTGLTNSRDQLWDLNVPGINGIVDEECRFGSELVSGDFNEDGFDDLAIAAVREEVGGVNDAGSVHVIYGSGSGLTASNDQHFFQGKGGIEDDPELNDHFGGALAVGDFNGDGYDDLAISAFGEDGVIGPDAYQGMIHIVFGTANKLNTEQGQTFTALDFPALNDDVGLFGSSLAAGDFNNDGFVDLAVGAPHAELDGQAEAGLVYVIYSHKNGLNDLANGGPYGVGLWSQGSPGILDTVETGDRFGWSLVAGDFDGDGRSDLAIGVPGENDGPVDSGLINVIYGFLYGLTEVGNQTWSQSSLLDDPEAGDQFGYSL